MYLMVSTFRFGRGLHDVAMGVVLFMFSVLSLIEQVACVSAVISYISQTYVSLFTRWHKPSTMLLMVAVYWSIRVLSFLVFLYLSDYVLLVKDESYVYASHLIWVPVVISNFVWKHKCANKRNFNLLLSFRFWFMMLYLQISQYGIQWTQLLIIPVLYLAQIAIIEIQRRYGSRFILPNS